MNLTVSRILAETLSAMKAHFWGLVGLWAVFFALMIGVVLAFGLALGGSAVALAGAANNPEALGGGLGAGMIGLIVIFYLAYLLVVSAQYAAMNAMTSPLKQASFGEAFAVGWRSAPTLLLVMIVLGIAYVIGGLLFGVVIGLLAALGSIGPIIGGVLLAALILYLVCRLLIVFPIVPVEGVRNPITAIGRAWGLTSGRVLPIFLSLLVFLIVVCVLFAIVLLPTIGTLTALADASGEASVGAAVLAIVGIVILSVVTAIAYAAYLSSVHALLVGGSNETAHAVAAH